MNGCCMSYADHGGHHDANCYFFWPCGCRRIRPNNTGTALPHTHPAVTYTEDPVTREAQRAGERSKP